MHISSAFWQKSPSMSCDNPRPCLWSLPKPTSMVLLITTKCHLPPLVAMPKSKRKPTTWGPVLSTLSVVATSILHQSTTVPTTATSSPPTQHCALPQ
ncbi:hypothetical protein ACHAW6_015626 [Cyclotella cf. meneghiniana]